jgi:hypothetical protein
MEHEITPMKNMPNIKNAYPGFFHVPEKVFKVTSLSNQHHYAGKRFKIREASRYRPDLLKSFQLH